MKKTSYDFYLILATATVLFIISLICIYGMFYFKFAQMQQMPAAMKIAYMNSMNALVSPFLVALILLLGICVPKRLLSTARLNRFAGVLIILALTAGLAMGVKAGLLLVLFASLILQITVLALALGGSAHLNFTKKGYWLRVGSSLLHLGLILFILDLFFYRQQTIHLILFWITTVAVLLGMIFCFYSESVVKLLKVKG